MPHKFHSETHSATAELMRHALDFRFEELNEHSERALKTFVLDTLGVMVSGSSADFSSELAKGLSRDDADGFDQASVLGTGERSSATIAAMRNAFHAHCQEFDCVHEAAVVHPLATVQPAAMAWAEREGGVSGRDFMSALAIGVDISTTIGMASNETLRFFRPATAGIFGTTAALARLQGLRGETFANAMGLALASCAGTMQPHDEGLCTLAVQVAGAARAAILAVDMAAAGVPGPQHWLQGPHGYLNLFEGKYDLEPRVNELQSVRRIDQVSHKPFPSGRATHGAIDGLLSLRGEHIDCEKIEKIDIFVPPLIDKLVGRPITPDMGVNYARLCLQYVGALALTYGTIEVTDYQAERIGDPQLQALGSRINIIVDDNPDPNALSPQRVVILIDGEKREIVVPDTLGSPANPLTHSRHLAKFRNNWRYARKAAPEQACEAVIDCVDRLQDLSDVRELCRLIDANV